MCRGSGAPQSTSRQTPAAREGRRRSRSGAAAASARARRGRAAAHTLTVPLCLPRSRSSSTPYQTPGLNCVSPTNLITALYRLLTSTCAPTGLQSRAGDEEAASGEWRRAAPARSFPGTRTHAGARPARAAARARHRAAAQQRQTRAQAEQSFAATPPVPHARPTKRGTHSWGSSAILNKGEGGEGTRAQPARQPEGVCTNCKDRARALRAHRVSLRALLARARRRRAHAGSA